MCCTEGGAAKAAAHRFRDGEVLLVDALNVVAIPGVAFVLMIDLVLRAKRRAAGAAVPLAFYRNSSACRAVADELTWPSLLAEPAVLVAVLGTYTLAALAGKVGPEVTISGTVLDVARGSAGAASRHCTARLALWSARLRASLSIS